ncbi:hypothetical protein [Cellulosimicrobium arenosum]|uniref:Uncharacterized protein n=1 Tax=Cellulosimicrobium arenosum TaxID=2708133 RepID=A0A927G7J8_9MICO|nr:hypothetical protein [Cellulosimicrobium arenosum]MBD8078376.1 hypothetical protein [Cellulosimicrobium arenosum]
MSVASSVEEVSQRVVVCPSVSASGPCPSSDDEAATAASWLSSPARSPPRVNWTTSIPGPMPRVRVSAENPLNDSSGVRAAQVFCAIAGNDSSTRPCTSCCV